ncbi:VOC family protein [Catenovulum sp. SM1970]|uniref:VOC family protein n=1 Tax=Marinifaba aquimaris TaxID=2741323 RepID=UPI001571D1A5|nr:VOC family protein [Marinifaba aquimaris]NTS76133.1 VOC family protein [Marinifaba aquimaris]
MIKPLGIDHLVLRTEQPQRLIDFYCDHLACQIERTQAQGIGLIQLRAGAALIDIVEVDSQLGRLGGNTLNKQGHNLDHFCLQLQVPSMASLIRYLNQHNIQFQRPANRYGATGFSLSVYIKDPDGNVIELKPVKT